MAARKSVEKTPETVAGRRVGYARVSTQEQVLDLQISALNAFGCVNIYEEKRSAGGTHRRPALDLAIKELRPGDTLVVWRLDRLARSMKEFYRRMEQIEASGANFHSITENFDFTTAMGKFVLGVLALVAELERQLTIQRTKAGLEVVRKRGVKLGAATKLTDDMRRRIKQLAAQKGEQRLKMQEIADRCGIAMSTIFAAFPGGRAAILAWKPTKVKAK
jgi:DNA invertase Pin-like site-specific DNA recombinase